MSTPIYDLKPCREFLDKVYALARQINIRPNLQVPFEPQFMVSWPYWYRPHRGRVQLAVDVYYHMWPQDSENAPLKAEKEEEEAPKKVAADIISRQEVIREKHLQNPKLFYEAIYRIWTSFVLHEVKEGFFVHDKPFVEPHPPPKARRVTSYENCG